MSHHFVGPTSCYPSVPHQSTVSEMCQAELDTNLLASYESEAFWWEVAAVTTQVAAGILTTGIFIASALYAPLFVPLAGVTAILTLKVSDKAHKILQKWSVRADARAEQLRQFQKNYYTLSTSTPEQIKQLLNERAIVADDANITILNPLIARDLFWEGQIQKLTLEMQKKLDSAAKLESHDTAEDKKRIYRLRSKAIELESLILESKIKNAFIRVAIQRPGLTGTLKDVGTFSNLTGQERALAIPLRIANAQDLFTFKNGSTPCITYSEAKSLTIGELAQRLQSGI